MLHNFWIQFFIVIAFRTFFTFMQQLQMLTAIAKIALKELLVGGLFVFYHLLMQSLRA